MSSLVEVKAGIVSAIERAGFSGKPREVIRLVAQESHQQVNLEFLSEGFFQWWRARERKKEIPTWEGLEEGTLSPEQYVARQKELFGQFCRKLTDKGVKLTEDQIEAGFAAYMK